jgi:hypothetical protein
MKRFRSALLRDKLGISYSIAAVIMSAVTIMLVIVASSYAYQLLDQQRGAAEFEVAEDSILAFDDALESIAWKPVAAQSARFTISYGQLELIPGSNPQVSPTMIDIEKNYVSLLDQPYSVSSGFIKYSTSNRYVNFWEGYKSYILGDAALVITNGTESLGRAFVEQTSGWVNITLDYRVRAMKTSTVTVNNVRVNYVNIWIVKLNIAQWATYIHDFNLKARCLNVSTTTYGPYSVDATDRVEIEVQRGSASSAIEIEDLETGNVVFNFILSEVKVSF